MVDSTKACETDWISMDLVSNSPTKTATIIDEGRYKATPWGQALELNIEMDGKQKTWTPNKDSCLSMNRTWGVDSKAWVGKQIRLELVNKNNKTFIVGVPIHGQAKAAIAVMGQPKPNPTAPIMTEAEGRAMDNSP